MKEKPVEFKTLFKPASKKEEKPAGVDSEDWEDYQDYLKESLKIDKEPALEALKKKETPVEFKTLFKTAAPKKKEKPAEPKIAEKEDPGHEDFRRVHEDHEESDEGRAEDESDKDVTEESRKYKLKHHMDLDREFYEEKDYWTQPESPEQYERIHDA